jgi:hypothetical protein
MKKSELARSSVNNLIRAIDSLINPNLIFRTQQTNSEDNAMQFLTKTTIIMVFWV